MKDAEFLIIAHHTAVPFVIKSFNLYGAIIPLIIFADTLLQALKRAEVFIEDVEAGLAIAFAQLAFLFDVLEKRRRRVEVVHFRGSFERLLCGGDGALAFPLFRRFLLARLAEYRGRTHETKDALLPMHLQLVTFLAFASEA